MHFIWIFKIYLFVYKNFYILPSSPYPPISPTLSLPPYPVLRAVRVSCPVGSSSSSPLPPGLGRWASKQTRIPKSQYFQMKAVPVPLSMASQTAPMSATFRESGLITCSFSHSPAGLGELSLDQSLCISGWMWPSRSWLPFSCSPSFCSSFGPWGLSPVLQCESLSISIHRRMKVPSDPDFLAHILPPSASHLDLTNGASITGCQPVEEWK